MSEFQMLIKLIEMLDSRTELREFAKRGYYSSWSESVRQVFRLKWQYAHCMETIPHFEGSHSEAQLWSELQITTDRSKNL